MDAGKPTKTPADYMVIAISPALIMVLVHSVCFFLVEVFYRGEAAGGVRWVLFWFVLAVVLIARIGMEQGTGHAMGYGLFLAAACWIYLSTIQPNVVFGAILLGVVWFTAHKITCDCTLIDDDADASGQGLVESLRRLPARFKKSPPPAVKALAPPPTSTFAAKVPAGKKRESQIPGVWLIYFSLAALPVFGLGQTLLPAGDMAARHRGFVYLFLYLAAACGLLMTTSFLGLRRYLRQRHLVMPGRIAAGWLQVGAIAVVVVLGVSLLLPRPGAGEAWGVLRYHVDYQLRRASEYAARFSPHGTGSGHAGNQAPPAGQPENPPPQAGPAPSQDQNAKTRPSGQGEQQSSDDSTHGEPAGKTGGELPGKSLPDLSPAAGAVYPWLKRLFWLAVATGAGWLIYRYRLVLLTMLRSAWTAMRNFMAMLRGWFGATATASVPASIKNERPRFQAFKNPFLTGANQVWPPEKLIAYSYDALQSWARETAAAQDSPQTPREFCRQLAEEMPEVAAALEHLAFLYGHVAYGATVPGSYNPEQLRGLWGVMASPRSKQAPVPVLGN